MKNATVQGCSIQKAVIPGGVKDLQDSSSLHSSEWHSEF